MTLDILGCKIVDGGLGGGYIDLVIDFSGLSEHLHLCNAALAAQSKPDEFRASSSTTQAGFAFGIFSWGVTVLLGWGFCDFFYCGYPHFFAGSLTALSASKTCSLVGMRAGSYLGIDGDWDSPSA